MACDCKTIERGYHPDVVWINPESPGAWGFGDSVMDRYIPLTGHFSMALGCSVTTSR